MAELAPPPVSAEMTVMAPRPHIEFRELDGLNLVIARGIDVAEIKQIPGLLQPDRREAGMPQEGSGVLVPIGGAATDENLFEFSRHIKDHTGLTIITAPTGMPDESFEEHEERFRSVGVTGEIHHLRKGTPKEKGSAMLAHSSAIFITGGDQRRGMSVLQSEGWDDEIRDFYNRGKNGTTVGGTSAGASMLGDMMPHGRKLIQGLGLIDLTIDQHIDRDGGRTERVRAAARATRRRTVGFMEGSGGVITSDTQSLHVFGGKDAVVAWQPNGHVELAAIPSEVDISMQVFDRRSHSSQAA